MKNKTNNLQIEISLEYLEKVIYNLAYSDYYIIIKDKQKLLNYVKEQVTTKDQYFEKYIKQACCDYINKFNN